MACAEFDEGTPSVRRLKHRKDFLKIAREGNKVVASTLVLQGFFAPENDAGTYQPDVHVGFTVTKKVGNAVVRNRIRRRLKAAVDLQLNPHECAGWEFVVIGRQSALEAPFDIITRDLSYGLRKLRKLRAEGGAA